MISSNFIVACTILSFWPHATTCDDEGKTNLSSSPELGFAPAREGNANNDDIDHDKPVLTNVDVAGKDYQKYRHGFHRSIQHADSSGNNVNLNVNHRDYVDRQWKKNWKKRNNERHKVDRLIKLLHVIPNSNDGYRIFDRRKKKERKQNPKRKELKSRRGNGSDELILIEAKGKYHNSIVSDALEYVKRVENGLSNLKTNLSLLLDES